MVHDRQEINETISGINYVLWRVFLKIALPILIFAAAATLIVVVIFRPFEVADRVTNPDRMIYTYERFHDLYAAIQATDVKIKTKQAQLDAFLETAPDGWRNNLTYNREYQMLQTELSGLREHQANQVAEYNAMAAKATRNFLRDGSLPERIP